MPTDKELEAFLLRMPPAIKLWYTEEAKRQHTSLNSIIIRVLAKQKGKKI